MKVEARLYQRIEGGMVRCGTCQRRCLIRPGRVGWCRTRWNEQGRLFSLVYGEVSSASINPIEKKPVYHYHPGSRWLSLGSVGCNFRCPGCQNWDISHWKRGAMGTRYLSPQDAVAHAKAAGCLGLSWTFNEPTLWLEYTVDAARAAKEAGLRTNYVTNGTMTEEAFLILAPCLDVFRVDVKGFSDATYRRIGHLGAARQVGEIAQAARRLGMHVEVVTNVIPGFNDADAELDGIAGWVNETLGLDTPWHVTRFFPHLRLSRLPATPIARLERARALGIAAGLRYVYLGNVPGHPWANTYCHRCGRLLIERCALDVVGNALRDGACPECGERLPGVF
jgi:pyruvate formate lyase activating enzyme